jgi:RHH-type proline utilization regulon transcriptional repressor/proline dehydrogenase/delta 1-pyrroline-5-carboxylate dehydrogenase
VSGIRAMPREIFGPVLHIATFRASEIDAVIDAVNATGYGLTFGLHTRIDDRVQRIVERLRVGNAYVNRNQIGAVVGSQPFGGEGLSGTGPKAGGPDYLHRFTCTPAPEATPDSTSMTEADVTRALAAPHAHLPDRSLNLPGPTGESNRLTLTPRAPLLCLGPGAAVALQQAEAIRKLGGRAVEAPGLAPDALSSLTGFSGALWWGDATTARAHAQALAARKGPILPLIGDMPDAAHALLERHVCIDTTASGGNAQLLAEVSD